MVQAARVGQNHPASSRRPQAGVALEKRRRLQEDFGEPIAVDPPGKPLVELEIEPVTMLQPSEKLSGVFAEEQLMLQLLGSPDQGEEAVHAKRIQKSPAVEASVGGALDGPGTWIGRAKGDVVASPVTNVDFRVRQRSVLYRQGFAVLPTEPIERGFDVLAGSERADGQTEAGAGVLSQSVAPQDDVVRAPRPADLEFQEARVAAAMKHLESASLQESFMQQTSPSSGREFARAASQTRNGKRSVRIGRRHNGSRWIDFSSQRTRSACR
jgi:hypothetical protein